MASNNVIGNRQKSILKNIVSFFFRTHMSRGFLIYTYVPRPYINARTHQGFMATIFRQYALAKKKIESFLLAMST